MTNTANTIPPLLPAGVTAGQVNTWKHQYGRVHSITVDFDGKKVVAIVRRPNLAIISATASVAQSDPIKAGVVMYDNCKLAADPEIEANDELKLSVTKVIGSLFKVYEAELGEL